MAVESVPANASGVVRPTREGLVQAIGLLLVHHPENVLHTLWNLLSYPPMQLRRAQLMILNCAESADLFYDAIRMDRIVRYLDAKGEEGLLGEIETAEAKGEARKAIEEFRGRLGLAITILRTQLGELAQRHKISFRGLACLGAHAKVYERSGQRFFARGPEPQPAAAQENAA